jgi:hypothetical protein
MPMLQRQNTETFAGILSMEAIRRRMKAIGAKFLMAKKTTLMDVPLPLRAEEKNL